MAKAKSNLKQLYLYQYGNYKPHIRYDKEVTTWDYSISPAVKLTIQGVPIGNPIGEYVLEFSHVYYRDWIGVIVLDAPDKLLQNALLQISVDTFNKCIKNNFFSKEKDKLIIQSTFQIFKGFLELR